MLVAKFGLMRWSLFNYQASSQTGWGVGVRKFCAAVVLESKFELATYRYFISSFRCPKNAARFIAADYSKEVSVSSGRSLSQGHKSVEHLPYILTAKMKK